MALREITETCIPREDVRRGGLTDAHFAAQLDQVVRSPEQYPVYGDPTEFFAITYPTEGLRSLLGGLTVGELLPSWSRALRAAKPAEGTIASHRLAANQFVTFVGERPMADYRPDDVRKFCPPHWPVLNGWSTG